MLRNKHTDRTDGCWIWLVGRDTDGYGQFRIGSRTLKAHRVSYTFFIGEIPKGSFVCHSCDNPPCINPKHLWLGDAKSNARDREKKKRGADRKGDKAPMVKLTWKKVQRIRAIKGLSQQKIGEKFDISQTAVGAILRNETWVI